MNKGKNKGKIQKSRQNAKGREAGSFLGKAFDSYHKFLSNKVINFVINMILAIGTVLPFMMKMCNKVAFTYEVNDDAAIVQILDGSYTGTPDGHAIFIKYPLSWIIAKLYELNPKLPFTVPSDNGTNWYVTAIVLLEVFALTAVLFRILNYFRCNRILICFFYTLAFVYVWMPCFFHLTFSTVAAFLGCMSLLFTGFAKKEELWRPWNLLCLGILGISAYCMRKQCFYMVIPFLLIEIWYKYRMDFFRSVKPWFIFGVCGVLGAGILFLNTQMYGSMGWKNYFIYNHARAYMQDYTGMPDYEENEDFYQSIGVSENAQKVFKSYSYCLYDDFSTETIEKIYNYQKTQEPQLSLEQKAENAKEKAYRYCVKKKQTGEFLKFSGFYVWFLIVPLTAVTLLFKWKNGFLRWVSTFLYGGTCAFLIYIEWIYLAMNGRFPQRVEESIRLLMLSVGFMIVCHLLSFWKDTSFIRISVVIQCILLAVILHMGVNGSDRIQAIQGIQAGREAGSGQKAEIAAYCGKHKENYYILDTQSFGKPSGVKDDLHQGNWYMSGSWTAYSPLYEEKLAKDGISNLGTGFLLKKNVYIITKGKKNVLNLLGQEDTGREAGSGQKAEIAAYCGKHKENYYILDTQSFGKPSGVKDDLHQGNWYMSGSWTAYSPLYEEKLAKDGISNLGTGFLLKKNVYIITKGKKNVLNLLGQEDTEHLTYKAVDEIEASGNLFFAVYKVSRSVK